MIRPIVVLINAAASAAINAAWMMAAAMSLTSSVCHVCCCHVTYVILLPHHARFQHSFQHKIPNGLDIVVAHFGWWILQADQPLNQYQLHVKLGKTELKQLQFEKELEKVKKQYQEANVKVADRKHAFQELELDATNRIVCPCLETWLFWLKVEQAAALHSLSKLAEHFEALLYWIATVLYESRQLCFGSQLLSGLVPQFSSSSRNYSSSSDHG
eukprot:Gb_00386 [translate_table: standard]